MTLVEVSRKYDVHQNQVALWKRQAQDNLSMIFEKESKSSSQSDAKEMHAKMGRQAMEIEVFRQAAQVNCNQCSKGY